MLFRACGCGSGDSGCKECGCCRNCAQEPEDDIEDVGGVDAPFVLNSKLRNVQQMLSNAQQMHQIYGGFYIIFLY